MGGEGFRGLPVLERHGTCINKWHTYGRVLLMWSGEEICEKAHATGPRVRKSGELSCMLNRMFCFHEEKSLIISLYELRSWEVELKLYPSSSSLSDAKCSFFMAYDIRAGLEPLESTDCHKIPHE
ncbi:hypothetical protein CHS0354_008403 [Potamilus streckersoni]|uniref:Uncharacterized protein n=1 Tax=Potamilus streckersoni TaxID=2493646 RepID=A0AAE0RPU5_9BIVA|nr:hypothetical protein CHS0354_008403 [Potamilus streckersoni]